MRLVREACKCKLRNSLFFGEILLSFIEFPIVLLCVAWVEVTSVSLSNLPPNYQLFARVLFALEIALIFLVLSSPFERFFHQIVIRLESRLRSLCELFGLFFDWVTTFIIPQLSNLFRYLATELRLANTFVSAFMADTSPHAENRLNLSRKWKLTPGQALTIIGSFSVGACHESFWRMVLRES